MSYPNICPLRARVRSAPKIDNQDVLLTIDYLFLEDTITVPHTI
jgi:hypothetical protein